MDHQSPVVLVVDDEQDVVETYVELLQDDFEIRVAYDGQEALDLYDQAVDVVLLDRRMPGLSGDEVLEELRDQPSNCRIAMVTAVEPDFDVIDMGFDDYLVKPVSGDELTETVQQLLARATYEEEVEQYFRLVTKRATLQAEKKAGELEHNDQYQDLCAEINELEARLSDVQADLTLEDYKATLRDLQQE